ncbi:hypothetical protein HYDPIDRAFT_171656, partial [Hydnomerulius pinastri MD-312]
HLPQTRVEVTILLEDSHEREQALHIHGKRSRSASLDSAGGDKLSMLPLAKRVARRMADVGVATDAISPSLPAPDKGHNSDMNQVFDTLEKLTMLAKEVMVKAEGIEHILKSMPVNMEGADSIAIVQRQSPHGDFLLVALVADQTSLQRFRSVGVYVSGAGAAAQEGAEATAPRLGGACEESQRHCQASDDQLVSS